MASVPLIAPSTDVGGLPPAPRLDPQEFAHSSTFGLRATARALGEVSDELHAAARAERTAKDELAKLELDRARLEMRRQYAEGVDQLKNDPTVSTEDYVQRVNRLGDQITEGVSKNLRDPQRTFDKFQLLSQQERIGQEIEARAYNRERLIQNVVAETALAGQRDRLLAVTGTPEQQEEAVQRFNTRVTNLVDRKFIGGGAGGAMKLDFMKEVTRGRAERQFAEGDAVNKNYIIGSLRSGAESYLDATEQRTLADQLERQEEQAESKRLTVLAAERKARAEEADKTLTDLTWSGDIAGAKGALAASRRDMTDERYHQWVERLKKGVVTVTDPEVTREMIGEVYNASNNPYEVDKRLREYWKNGKIAEDDMKPWASHLESRINRAENRSIAEGARRDAASLRDEARLGREEANVEQDLRAITTMQGPGAQALNVVAQDTYNWAIQDMRANMPGYGGNERPMQWLNRRRPEIYARLGQPALQRLDTIDQEFLLKHMPGTTGRTKAAVHEALKALEANKNTMRTDVYMDQTRLLKQKIDILTQMERWGPNANTYTQPAASAPASNAKPPSGPPPGQVVEPAFSRGRR